MALQRSGRSARRAITAAAHPHEPRTWLSHALAGAGISVLGLAIAGSISLTTSAQPPGQASELTSVEIVAGQAGVGTLQAPQVSKGEQQALLAFSARGPAADRTSRGALLRGAVVKEQAAQRAEALARSAEDVTRFSLSTSGDVRQRQLTAAEKASRAQAIQIAQENVRRAIAARLAAQNNLQNAGGFDPSAYDFSTLSTGGGYSPVPGAVIRARFGQYGLWSRYHTGLDFRAAYGTPIRAAKSGVVVFSGNKGDWAGNHVAILHGDRMTSMSSHMSATAVRAGQVVQAGQIIGYVGQTGRAFGAHLHYAIYPPGVTFGDVYRAINPQPWLAANGIRTN